MLTWNPARALSWGFTMAIEVTCNCGKKLTATDDKAGLRGRCPSCRAVILMPDIPPSRRGPTAESFRAAFGPTGRMDIENATFGIGGGKSQFQRAIKAGTFSGFYAQGYYGTTTQPSAPAVEQTTDPKVQPDSTSTPDLESAPKPQGGIKLIGYTDVENFHELTEEEKARSKRSIAEGMSTGFYSKLLCRCDKCRKGFIVISPSERGRTSCVACLRQELRDSPTNEIIRAQIDNAVENRTDKNFDWDDDDDVEQEIISRPTVQCEAILKSGQRCKRRTSEGSRCHQHR